jgi:hypothetical protein
MLGLVLLRVDEPEQRELDELDLDHHGAEVGE